MTSSRLSTNTVSGRSAGIEIVRARRRTRRGRRSRASAARGPRSVGRKDASCDCTQRRGAAPAGRRWPGRYFFGAICAEVALVLGGAVAVPGGECAPAASSGFEAAGVTVARTDRGRDRRTAASAPRGRRGRLPRGAAPCRSCDSRRPRGPATGRACRRRPCRSRRPWRRLSAALALASSDERRQLGQRPAGASAADSSGRAVDRTHGFPRRRRFQAAGCSARAGGGGALRCAGILPAAMSSYQSWWCSRAQPSST